MMTKGFFRLTKQEAVLLAIILLLGLAARWTYVARIQSPPFSDMADYDSIARSLLDGEGFSREGKATAYRPPAYPVFIALVYAIAGRSPETVRLIQAFLGTAGCLLSFFLARFFLLASPLSQSRNKHFLISLGALVTVLILAFYDEWIFFCGQLLSETLYVLLLVAWLLLLVFREQNTQGTIRGYAFLGLLAGILTLTRPVALFSICPALLVVFYRRYRQGDAWRTLIRWMGVFITGWAIFCLPWMVRNAWHFGAGAGLSTNTGINFYIGHNEYFGYWSTGDKERIRQLTQLNEAEESKLFLQIGLRYCLNHPGRTLLNSLTKIHYLFLEPWRPYPQSGQSFVDVWIPWSRKHIAPYKPWPWYGHGRELPPVDGFYPYPLLPWGLPLLTLVLVGLALAIHQRCRWGILYAAMGGHILSCLVFFARARFRVPLGFLFALLAAFALVFLMELILSRFRQKEGQE